MPKHAVDLSGLDLGRQLGQGGQGAVFPVANKRINESGEAWEVVYKQYNATVLPTLDAAALEAMVELLDVLEAKDGRWLCEKTAWPAAVVRENGSPRGFLMRSVPEQYRFTLPGLSASSAGTRRLANFEFLLNDDAYVASTGLKVSELDRLLLLADVADTLARLHRLGIVVGDLSPKNLLFALDPEPGCFVIDCDAVRLRGSSVLPQVETPEWQVPDGEEKATRGTDVYKLGLLAVRMFAREQAVTDPAALEAVSPRLGELARLSLDEDPLRRPTPVQWSTDLIAASPQASTVPAKAPAKPKPSPKPPIRVKPPAKAKAANTRPAKTAKPARSTKLTYVSPSSATGSSSFTKSSSTRTGSLATSTPKTPLTAAQKKNWTIAAWCIGVVMVLILSGWYAWGRPVAWANIGDCVSNSGASWSLTWCSMPQGDYKYRVIDKLYPNDGDSSDCSQVETDWDSSEDLDYTVNAGQDNEAVLCLTPM